MKTRRLNYQRPLSMFLAALMTVSNIYGTVGVLAADVEPEVVSQEEEAVQEDVSVEEPIYEIKLPAYEGCSYSFDKEHLEKKSDKEIILDYHADDEVKIGVNVAEPYYITDFHLYDSSNHEPAYSWNAESGKLAFFMPETNLHLNMALDQMVSDETVVFGEPDVFDDTDVFDGSELPVLEELPEIPVEDVFAAEAVEDTGADTIVYEASVEDDSNMILQEEQDTEVHYSDEQATESQVTESQPEEAVSVEVEQPVQETADESESKPAQDYEMVIEADGLPSQGSIVQVDTVTIPFDSWEFDPKTNFTNINYDQNAYDITYISDDVDFVNAGTYSSIYRVQQRTTERMWYALRPVRVSDQAVVSETDESEDAVSETVASDDEKEEAASEDADPDPREVQELVTEEASEAATEVVEEEKTEAFELLTEDITEAESETAPESESVTEAVVVTEEETEATDISVVTEEESEAVDISSEVDYELMEEDTGDEQLPADLILEEVPEEEMYYLSLPQEGETEVLKKRTIWNGDTTLDLSDYIPMTSTIEKASVMLEKGSVNVEKIGSYELVYRAVLDENPDYSWKIIAPFEVVADKYEADFYSDEYDSLMYLRNYGDSGKKGEVPKHICDTVKGKDLTVISGEDFNLLEADFDYDWDVWGLDIANDGGFDSNTCGTYPVVYEMFAWEDLSQVFYISSDVTVMEREEKAGNTVIHIQSGELTATVTTRSGKTYEASYGCDAVVSEQIKKVVVASTYGHDIAPEITVMKDGEAVASEMLITKLEEKGDSLILSIDNSDQDAAYELILDNPISDPYGKIDKRSDDWVNPDDEETPVEKESGIGAFFGNLLAADPFVMHVEAADDSKKWTGKSTIVKSLQTYGADSGYSEVGAKSKAHVYLKDSLITSIKSWIVDTQGLDLEGKIPTMIDVKCCSPGLWGWYSSGALSQCCSGVSLTASIERNSAGEATKVKLYLKCTGASGFQSFSGTVRIPVSEGGGTLTLIKKSTSDNFIKTFTDIKIDTTFMIYDNEACTHEVADIDIDPKSDSGTSVSAVVELDEGTYWIVETHRMVGHICNTKKYKVVIGNGQNTNLTVENEPYYFNGIFLEKKDSATGAPLAGAVFKVTGVRKDVTIGTWYFKSDASGNVAYDAAHYLASWNGHNSNALIMMNDTIGAALPNSVTLTVQEVQAPAGYLLDSTEHTVGVSKTADGTEGKVARLTCTPIAKKNQKDEGYLTLIKKDSELGSKVPNKEFYSLAGAVYTVYDSASKVVGTLTTKEDGTTNTIALPTGTYTVKETTAPKGYTLNKDVITVKLTVANTATAPYKAQATDEAEHGKLKIHKISDENESSAIWKKRDLSGVTFKLTYTKDTSITRTVKTDASGYATVTGLFLGEWKIEELTPPKYHVAIEPEIITIDDMSLMEAEIENVRYMADITLVKKEAGTGNVVKRAGAKFQIIDEVGNKVSLKVKGASSATDTFVTGADGKVTFAEKIPAGKYTLKELAAPAGYKKGSDVPFEVPNDKAVTVEMKDERAFYTGITVTKKDADSGNIAGAGFEFGIYAENDILDGSNTPYAGYEKGKLIEKSVTGTDGKASFTKSLYPGNYVIKETKAVPGYKLNSTDVIHFEVTEKAPQSETGDWTCEVNVLEGDTTFTFMDEPDLIPLKVTKKDAKSGSLAGAGFVFELYAENVADGSGKVRAGYEKGKLIDTLTTDETSTAVSKDLYAGTYSLKEVVRIARYELNTNVYTIDVKPNGTIKTVEYTVKDEPFKKQIQVTKIDEETGNRCGAGFVFTIYVAEDICDGDGNVYDGFHEGDIAGIMTTDENGIAVSPELLIGKYLVQETEVPESGYSINDTKYPVELTDEKDGEGNLIATEKQTLVVEMDDIKDKPTQLHLKKVDAVDGKTLAGITFRVKEEGAEDSDDQLYVTDENGEFTAKYLKKSRTYVITEVETIPGYNLNTDVFTVAVDESGLIEDNFEYSMTVENQPNVTEVSKQDITNSEELPGASLKVTDKDGNVIDEWISGEEPHIIYGMAAGEYVLTEIASPEKYEEAEEVTFTITDTLEVQKVVMKDSPFRKVTVSKQDITNEAEVPGCTLTIKDSEGEVVETWISEEEPHMVELHSGTYTLIEERPAEKYEEAEEVTFEVIQTSAEDFEISHVEMFDSPFRKVEISKKDITGEEEIPGCTLTIKDAEGEVVDTWVSEEEPHMTELHSGTYSLVEENPAPGYVTAEEVAFEVIQTTAEDFEVSHVEMKDDITKVTISKTDITTGEELPGAKLTITDAEGSVVEEWVSTEDPHYIEKLPIGTYTLTEVAAPDYYSRAESIEFTVEDTGEIQAVEMKDKLIEVSISKRDITDDKELPGAKLEVKDDKGNVIETWVSTEEEHLINLKTGTYTLTEITAPEGYEVAETITFEVTDSMEVQHVQMYDSPKETYINLTGKKREIRTGGNPGTPGTTVTSPPVQTGDCNRFLAGIILIVIGGCAVTVLNISNGKRKKKE